MPYGWEGNRGSGVALAMCMMRHGLQCFIQLRNQDLTKTDEQPAYTPHGIWFSLPLLAKESTTIDGWQLSGLIATRAVRHERRNVGNR